MEEVRLPALGGRCGWQMRCGSPWMASYSWGPLGCRQRHPDPGCSTASGGGPLPAGECGGLGHTTRGLDGMRLPAPWCRYEEQ